MIKKLTRFALAPLVLWTGAALAAGGDEVHIHDVDFSFDGPFGTYDQNQLQRGLQIYTEVCSACHGLKHVPLRTLADEDGVGLPEDQVRAYAAEFYIFDAELDDERPREPKDFFPSSALSNAPDLSLIAKARTGFHGPMGTGINQLMNGIGGPEYIAAILIGYEDTPACAPEDFSGYYNTAFASGGYPDECKIYDAGGIEIDRKAPGSWISMAPPLYGEDIDFIDGHPNTLHHESEDVAAFLMWAAEPKMMARKRAGFVAVILLTMLTTLLYLTNKKLWAPHKGEKFDI
jgi:ubiquinol-cytochrome c reductase cytochrome c1 subunit